MGSTVPAVADTGYVVTLSTRKPPAPLPESKVTERTISVQPLSESNPVQPRLEPDKPLPPYRQSTAVNPLNGEAGFPIQQEPQRQQEARLATSKEMPMLVCIGQGRADLQRNATTSSDLSGTARGSSVWSSGKASGSSTWNGTVDGRETSTMRWTETVAFQDQIGVRFDGDTPRIRLPGQLTPIARGGSAGWMKIRNLEIAVHEITGLIAVNILNMPRLHIDRRTGLMTISAPATLFPGFGTGGTFTAMCEAVDPERTQRRF